MSLTDSGPKVIDLVVNNDLCIGCGLCTYKCSNNALEMQWNEFGFLVPKLIDSCESDGDCILVCPFNPFPNELIKTENELADLNLKDAVNFHPKIGKYTNIYAGYSYEFRRTSSSGGLATFVLMALLEKGIVDHIFSVKECEYPNVHYEYAVSSNKSELLESSKTKYFPVTLANVFSKIDDLEGKVAIVGIACFLKAIRLAQFSDSKLKEKIPFLVGIICGGVKSRFFTEYLSIKAGVQKEHCYKPEFRIKDSTSTASDYSFGCTSGMENLAKTVKMKSIGDMWGTGLFKANACDFCDDVTTELADVSLGDAWLEPFVNDGMGTNVVITRSLLAESIIKEGTERSKLKLELLDLEKFISSQRGSFNHRHDGLAYRVNRANKTGMYIPPKRFSNQDLISFDFKIVQYLRLKVRKRSLKIWKNYANAIEFEKKIKLNLLLLRIATRFNHYIKRVVKE